MNKVYWSKMIKAWETGSNAYIFYFFYSILVDEALYGVVLWSTYDGVFYFIIIMYVLTMAIKANWWIHEHVLMMILCESYAYFPILVVI